MIRCLLGRIAALWRPAAILPRKQRRGPVTAKETQTMDAHMPAGSIGPEGDGPAGDIGPGAGARGRAAGSAGLPPVAREDLLARAMVSIGIDFDRLAERERALLYDMHRACAGCHGRSRCRRDLGTGDFARRYRHYCPNAERLARLAADAAFRADAAGAKSFPPEHA